MNAMDNHMDSSPKLNTAGKLNSRIKILRESNENIYGANLTGSGSPIKEENIDNSLKNKELFDDESYD